MELILGDMSQPQGSRLQTIFAAQPGAHVLFRTRISLIYEEDSRSILGLMLCQAILIHFSMKCGFGFSGTSRCILITMAPDYRRYVELSRKDTKTPFTMLCSLIDTKILARIQAYDWLLCKGRCQGIERSAFRLHKLLATFGRDFLLTA